jgi:hypothetical protein
MKAMTKTTVTPAAHPNSEVVTAAPAGPGVIAHKRNHQRGGGVPMCLPAHEHPCANAGKGRCTSECRCVCDCKPPTWFGASAGWAQRKGAVLCDEPQCYGGKR